MTYQVIDIQTKKVVRTFKTSRAARDFADQRDSAYGAVRYVVRIAE